MQVRVKRSLQFLANSCRKIGFLQYGYAAC